MRWSCMVLCLYLGAGDCVKGACAVREGEALSGEPRSGQAAAVLVWLACECAQCKRRVDRLANVPIGATGS